MVTTTHKRKTLHYRKSKFLVNPKKSLQQTMDEALSALATVKARLETPTADTTVHRVINTHRQSQGMLFGSFVLYEDGTNKTLIILDLTKAELAVEHMAPPSGDGKRREFLESVAYFGVLDDHVVLLQSSALRADDFENHVLWLLREGKVITSANRLSLDESLPKPTQKKIKQSHVKSIAIGAPLETSTAKSSGHKNLHSAKRLRFAPTGVGFNVLQQLLPRNWFRDRELKSALDDSRLEVTVELSYSYSTTDDGQELLDDIATELRHVDKDSVEIALRGGGTVKGDELRIRKTTSIKTINGVIDESDLYPKMHAFLKEQIENKLIDP